MRYIYIRFDLSFLSLSRFYRSRQKNSCSLQNFLLPPPLSLSLFFGRWMVIINRKPGHLVPLVANIIENRDGSLDGSLSSREEGGGGGGARVVFGRKKKKKKKWRDTRPGPTIIININVAFQRAFQLSQPTPRYRNTRAPRFLSVLPPFARGESIKA